METDRKEFDDAGVKTDDVEIKEFSAQAEIPPEEWIKSISEVEVQTDEVKFEEVKSVHVETIQSKEEKEEIEEELAQMGTIYSNSPQHLLPTKQASNKDKKGVKSPETNQINSPMRIETTE